MHVVRQKGIKKDKCDLAKKHARRNKAAQWAKNPKNLQKLQILIIMKKPAHWAENSKIVQKC